VSGLSNSERLPGAFRAAFFKLLACRNSDGYWTGELSASALSTATAVGALALVHQEDPVPALPVLTANGLDWLARHQNPDGGWGDTIKSLSNISTTMLGRAAFHLTGAADRYHSCLLNAEKWLASRFGTTPEQQAEAVRARYGKDRTFAVPILTTCALAGLVDWKEVPPLPFELACFPQAWFRFLRLPVVSYALPALIAIGQAVYHHRRPWNPFTRLVRRLAIRKSLRVLEAIQPSSGGFLEATPLTGFVTLSLAGIGRARHPVAQKGVQFLTNSVRPDGSWPIDTNLATWVTTLSINALSAADCLQEIDSKEQLLSWLLTQQFQSRHPYTGSDPGGWGWTDLPGSVPDADDTSGAVLALYHLGMAGSPEHHGAGIGGLRWLLGLQNADGGFPTFCRGWGHLPFDRSGSDLTAHALRALAAWKPQIESDWELRMKHAAAGMRLRWVGVPPSQLEEGMARALGYLEGSQRPDGSWLPLWFGNQHAPDDENPTYGTARVLAAYRDLAKMNAEPARRGIGWLLAAQNADGGWGGAPRAPSTIEETALAVEVLLDAGADAQPAVNTGLAWLVQQVEGGRPDEPAPIGFYFAKLWYFERLYPIIFSVAALGRALTKLSSPRDAVRKLET
jgi:squalene-hopene/tetraprenyl-beta-curcumene cyclase